MRRETPLPCGRLRRVAERIFRQPETRKRPIPPDWAAFQSLVVKDTGRVFLLRIVVISGPDPHGARGEPGSVLLINQQLGDC